MITKFDFNKKIYLLSFIISLGIFYRLYHANFDDYWLDEFFGFWISDPSLEFKETLSRSFGPGWGQNLLFDFLLKYYYAIFGYYPENGRYFTVFLSSVSIILITYLSYQIDDSKSYILTAFITSHCWYLISYSQEVRSYSFGFLLALISFIFFIHLIKSKEDIITNKKIIFVLYNLINLIGLINHIFFALLVFSHFIFLLNFFNEKNKIKYFLTNYLILGVIYLLIMFPFLEKNLASKDFWVSQVGFEFFISYFFPRFFGSKLMGYLYLIIFLFLLIKSKEIIFSKKSIFQLFLILIFSSYFFPLIYSLIKLPILIDRYIIFVLIPIILFISILTFKQNDIIKKTLIVLIVLFTFSNNYLEIFKRNSSKPEFKQALKHIQSQNNLDIFIPSNSFEGHEWLLNYLKKINYSQYKRLQFLEYKNLGNQNQIWYLCYLPLNSSQCNVESLNNNYEIIETKSFYLVEVYLIKNSLS